MFIVCIGLVFGAGNFISFAHSSAAAKQYSKAIELDPHPDLLHNDVEKHTDKYH